VPNLQKRTLSDCFYGDFGYSTYVRVGADYIEKDVRKAKGNLRKAAL